MSWLHLHWKPTLYGVKRGSGSYPFVGQLADKHHRGSSVLQECGGLDNAACQNSATFAECSKQRAICERLVFIKSSSGLLEIQTENNKELNIGKGPLNESFSHILQPLLTFNHPPTHPHTHPHAAQHSSLRNHLQVTKLFVTVRKALRWKILLARRLVSSPLRTHG